MIGMAAVIVSILGFLVYHYRKKNKQPLVVNRDRYGYADTPYGREFPTDCPCGCGLNWSDDMPYPPHYSAPPYARAHFSNQQDVASRVQDHSQDQSTKQ